MVFYLFVTFVLIGAAGGAYIAFSGDDVEAETAAKFSTFDVGKNKQETRRQLERLLDDRRQVDAKHKKGEIEERRKKADLAAMVKMASKQKELEKGKLSGAKSVKPRMDVTEALQQLQEREANKKKAFSLRNSLEQSNWSMSPTIFILISLTVGFAGAMAYVIFVGPSIIFAPLAGAAASLIPLFLMRKALAKRLATFSNEFPNALDTIVRGVRSGLPVVECMRSIERDSHPIIAVEFGRVNDLLNVGMTQSEAIGYLHKAVPIQETQFFGIVLNVQQSTGGNLSSALGNLSGVLRERKKMQNKIKATSMEAKVSAGIIGAMPFLVTGLIALMSPGYLDVMFDTTMGNYLLIAAGVWMTIGVVVMRSMINFKI